MIEATRKRLSSEFRVIKGGVESFGGESKDTALRTLDDVNHRFPILSEVNQNTVNRVTNFLTWPTKLLSLMPQK